MGNRMDRLVVSQDNYHMSVEFVPQPDSSFLAGVAEILDVDLFTRMGYLSPQREWTYLVGPVILQG